MGSSTFPRGVDFVRICFMVVGEACPWLAVNLIVHNYVGEDRDCAAWRG